MLKLGYDSVRDLVLGSALLGCGGGGDPIAGMRILEEALNNRVNLIIKGLDEMDDDDFIATAYFCGPVGSYKNCKRKGSLTYDQMIKAINIFEERFHVNISALYAVELGGYNTAIALKTASILGLPFLDADAAGRAVPELAQSTIRIFGKELYPSIIVDLLGNYIIIEKYSSIDFYENLSRYLTELSCGSVFIVDGVLSVRDAKRMLIRGTITKSIYLGKNIRENLGDKSSIIKKISSLINGYYIGGGIIRDVDLDVVGGFLEGTYLIKEKKEVIKIYVKNENIAVWLENKPLALPPDLIILLDEEGYPVINSRIKEGMSANLIVAKAPDLWRTKKGLEILGPRHFNIKDKYVPVEELVKRLNL